ncbi:MAG: helix-turn-helix transcriptional regulator [Thermodesulfobacteriota bacterium]
MPRLPFPLEHYFDLRKLRKHCRRRGLNGSALGRLLGLSPGVMAYYLRGGGPLPLYWFRQVCAALELDPLEVCELLRLPVLDWGEVNRFRAACRRAGTTPFQALQDFLTVFVQEAREAKEEEGP